MIALNPEEDTKLPYLLHLPFEGGLTLKGLGHLAEVLPRLLSPFEGACPHAAEIVTFGGSYRLSTPDRYDWSRAVTSEGGAKIR